MLVYFARWIMSPCFRYCLLCRVWGMPQYLSWPIVQYMPKFRLILLIHHLLFWGWLEKMKPLLHFFCCSSLDLAFKDSHVCNVWNNIHANPTHCRQLSISYFVDLCYLHAWTALRSHLGYDQSCSTGVERLLMRMVSNFLPIYFSFLFP